MRWRRSGSTSSSANSRFLLALCLFFFMTWCHASIWWLTCENSILMPSWGLRDHLLIGCFWWFLPASITVYMVEFVCFFTAFWYASKCSAIHEQFHYLFTLVVYLLNTFKLRDLHLIIFSICISLRFCTIPSCWWSCSSTINIFSIRLNLCLEKSTFQLLQLV